MTGNREYIKNIETAEPAVCDNAESFLQSSMWGEFKSCFGWESRAFLIYLNDHDTVPLLAISRKLAICFSFVYIPMGPRFPANFPEENRATALKEISLKLKQFLPRGTVFLRFEPPWYNVNGSQFTDSEASSFTAAGLKKAAASIQPPDTVLVNLEPPVKKILEAMKQKWRYNISLAQKKNVIVKSCGVEELETFYSLLKETAKRDGILVHSFDYYKTIFKMCEKYGDKFKLILYTASHENDIIAAIVVLFHGICATYLYGASSDKKRNMMPSYALQWTAIRDAKEAGCKSYDLFGIPPDDNPNHPMAGLYRFKTGFGGQIVHRPGCWDYPYKPFLYNLFYLTENLRKKLLARRKKR